MRPQPLMIFAALFAGLALFSAPPIAKAQQVSSKDCKITCKTQKKACQASFKAQFDAAKTACGSDKQCKKDAKNPFKADKKSCVKDAAGFETCKTCCKGEDTAACGITICGDGQTIAPEQCDDGNKMSGDACSAECAPEGGEFMGGMRTLSIGPDSAFFSSFLPSTPIGAVSGTLVLEASEPDENGASTVTTVGGPLFVKIDISVLGQAITVCSKIDSCTGRLLCNGGENVDVVVELDSLGTGLTCEHTGACDGAPCCANSCEGVNVGSGNRSVNRTGVNSGTDSGAGAMIITCQQAGSAFALGTDCTAQTYGPPMPAVYTTGTATARVTQHCEGNGAPAGVVPEFGRKGRNFSCATWTVENSAGALAFAIPTEEPTAFLGGDGSNAGVADD